MKLALTSIKPTGNICIKMDKGGFFQSTKQALIPKIVELTDSYLSKGFRLTLRQLYYQLVARNTIPNDIKVYKKLGDLVVELREGGLVDWDSIEDRVRGIEEPQWFSSIPSAQASIVSWFRLQRMSNQDRHVEVWIEKDALSSLCYQITEPYGIPLLANHGYSSCTAVMEAVHRMKRDGRPCVILYCGDHDPSGLDMPRDLTDRLNFYSGNTLPFTLHRIALTMEQIQQLNLPPNPAKDADPRADKYREEFGDESWELDSIDPEVFQGFLRTEIEKNIDRKRYEEKVQQEWDTKNLYNALAEELTDSFRDNNWV